MTIIIIGLCAVGAFEAYVFHVHHFPEDLLLSVVSFGIGAFLAALWVNGVGV